MCDVSYLKIKSKQLPLMDLVIRLFTMKSFFIVHHIFVFLLIPVLYVSNRLCCIIQFIAHRCQGWVIFCDSLYTRYSNHTGFDYP